MRKKSRFSTAITANYQYHVKFPAATFMFMCLHLFLGNSLFAVGVLVDTINV